MAVKFKNGIKPAPKKGGTDYSEHLISAPGKGTTTVQKKQAGGEYQQVSEKQEDVSQILVPKDQLAVVTVGGRQTINIGNYESVQISVQVSLPCDKGQINEVYDFATDWVSERISKAVNTAKGD